MSTSKMSPAHAQLVQHFLGAVPHEMGTKAVFITFPARDPVTVAFADQCVTVTVRLQEIKTGALRLPGLTMKAGGTRFSRSSWGLRRYARAGRTAVLDRRQRRARLAVRTATYLTEAT